MDFLFCVDCRRIYLNVSRRDVIIYRDQLCCVNTSLTWYLSHTILFLVLSLSFNPRWIFTVRFRIAFIFEGKEALNSQAKICEQFGNGGLERIRHWLNLMSEKKKEESEKAQIFAHDFDIENYAPHQTSSIHRNIKVFSQRPSNPTDLFKYTYFLYPIHRPNHNRSIFFPRHHCCLGDDFSMILVIIIIRRFFFFILFSQ